MLNRIAKPGLFITGTDTNVGKTVVAAAIAGWLQQRGSRVGVCKIAATGCEQQGDQLVSHDAVYLASAAKSPFSYDVICPIRYAEPLAPAVAAERSGVPLDWLLLQSSLNTLAGESDCLIIEGVGGVMVPMDDRYTVLDVAQWLGLPTVIVARPGLGTINHTLLAINALRSAGVCIAGVVINRYLNDPADAAQQTNAAAIEKWGQVAVLCMVPEDSSASKSLPVSVSDAIDRVNWTRLF